MEPHSLADELVARAEVECGPLSDGDRRLIRASATGSRCSLRHAAPGVLFSRVEGQRPDRNGDVHAKVVAWLCGDGGARLAGKSLRLSRARIDERVILRRLVLPGITLSFHDCALRGGVDLEAAHVGDVSFRRCALGLLSGAASTVVNAEDARCDGDLTFQDAALWGLLDLHGVQVGGRISVRDAVLGDVDLHDAAVAGRFSWYRVRPSPRTGPGRTTITSPWLDLRTATVRAVRIDSSAPAAVELDGLVCERLAVFGGGDSMTSASRGAADRATERHPDILGDDAARKVLVERWLARTPAPRLEPYLRFAKTLRDMGNSRDAQHVMIAGHVRRRDGLRRWRFRWLANVVGQVFNYGYRFGLGAILCSVALVALGTVIFAVAKARNPALLVPVGDPPHVPFSAPLYSLDVAIPFADLHQEKSWSPTGRGVSATLLSWWLSIEIVAGYALSAFVVAHFTGILRRE